MFSTLLLLSTMLLRELGSLKVHTRSHGRLRAAMCTGTLAILLTAIYPEHLERSDDVNLNFVYVAAYALHAFGLSCACILTVATPFVWICMERRRIVSRGGGWRLVAVRLVHVALASGASLNFGILRAHADVTDYCAPLSESPSACEAWPVLPPAACEAIVRPTHYRCAYFNNTLSADAERLLPPEYVALHRGQCRKSRCTLYANVRSIASEFASLFLISTYVPHQHAFLSA